MLPLVLRRLRCRPRRRRHPPPTTLPSRRPFVTSRSARGPTRCVHASPIRGDFLPRGHRLRHRRRLREAHLLLCYGAYAAAGVRQRRLLLRAWLSSEALAAATYLANVDCSFMDNPVDLVTATEPGATRSPCPRPSSSRWNRFRRRRSTPIWPPESHPTQIWRPHSRRRLLHSRHR
jgi:hypothetical protein